MRTEWHKLRIHGNKMEVGDLRKWHDCDETESEPEGSIPIEVVR